MKRQQKKELKKLKKCLALALFDCDIQLINYYNEQIKILKTK